MKAEAQALAKANKPPVQLPDGREAFLTLTATRPQPLGRPCEYTDQIAQTILARLAAGETMRKICKDKDMPDRETVRRWALKGQLGDERYSSFAASIAYAKVYTAESLVETAVDRALDATTKDEAHTARVVSDTLLKVAARLDPANWAEQRLGGGQGVTVHITTDLPAQNGPDEAFVIDVTPDEG